MKLLSGWSTKWWSEALAAPLGRAPQLGGFGDVGEYGHRSGELEDRRVPGIGVEVGVEVQVVQRTKILMKQYIDSKSTL